MDGRRRLQFGLGSLFWLMVVVALAIYGIGEHRQRRRAEQELSFLQFQAVWASLQVTPEDVEFSATH
jgi:hypothetical protein